MRQQWHAHQGCLLICCFLRVVLYLPIFSMEIYLFSYFLLIQAIYCINVLIFICKLSIFSSKAGPWLRFPMGNSRSPEGEKTACFHLNPFYKIRNNERFKVNFAKNSTIPVKNRLAGWIGKNAESFACRPAHLHFFILYWYYINKIAVNISAHKNSTN